MAKLGRLITAMVTPFNAKGEVDYKQAQKLAKALIKSGSDGLVITGTTGERPTVTDEEQLKLFATVREAIGDTGTIIAGTGGNCTRESIAITREAEKLGVDAALLIVPYYNKPTQEGMYQHFKAIAESTSLPCILYNVPARTVTNLAPETALRLSQIDNIVGIKEASGNMEQVAKIIQGAPQGFPGLERQRRRYLPHHGHGRLWHYQRGLSPGRETDQGHDRVDGPREHERGSCHTPEPAAAHKRAVHRLQPHSREIRPQSRRLPRGQATAPPYRAG